MGYINFIIGRGGLLVLLAACLTACGPGSNRSYQASLPIREPERSTNPSNRPPNRLAEHIAKLTTIDDPQARSLLIFLDDSEIATHQNAVSELAIVALLEKTSSIFITGSLLSRIFAYPLTGQNDLEPLLKVFWGQFDARDWTVKKLDEAGQFFLMVPEHNLKDEKTGLYLSRFETLEANSQEAFRTYFSPLYGQFLKEANDDLLGKNFLKVFRSLFVPKSVYENKEVLAPSWIIYLLGHGLIGYSIANLSVQGIKSEFHQMLDVLKDLILTKFFVYVSCYSGGFNAQKIYGDLTSTIGIRLYPFPIAMASTTDAVTLTVAPQIDENAVYGETSFKGFVENAKKIVINFEKSLSYVMPLIKRAEYFLAELAGIPQLRPANSPAWFPVQDIDGAVIRIGKVMSLTRKDPLLIQPYRNFLGSLSNPKAILLATDQVPFPITLDDRIEKQPVLLSTTPGLSVHEIARLDMRHLKLDPLALVGWSPGDQKWGKIKYGATKLFWIKAVKDQFGDYKDLIIETKSGHIKAYFTDMGGNSIKLAGENDLPDYVSHYREMAEKMRRSARAGILLLNVDERLPGGKTRLMLAVEEGNLDAVRRLLEAGADVRLRDNRNRSALDRVEKLAKSFESHRIKQLLEKALKETEVK